MKQKRFYFCVPPLVTRFYSLIHSFTCSILIQEEEERKKKELIFPLVNPLCVCAQKNVCYEIGIHFHSTSAIIIME